MNILQGLKTRSIIQVIPTLILLLVVSTATSSPPVFGAEIISKTVQSEDESPILTTLKLSELPLLGQVVRLSCTVESIYDSPGTQVSLELPQGAQVLDGVTHWQGDLIAGEEVTFSARVKFTAEGNTTLRCRAYRPIDATNAWGSLAALFLNIGQFESLPAFAAIPWQADTNTQLEIPGDGILIPGGAAAGANQPETPQEPQGTFPNLDIKNGDQVADSMTAAGDLTVTGTWQYHDRSNNHAIARDLLIEILRGDNENHLAWCWADFNGYYSCGPFTNPGSVGVKTRMYTYVSYDPYSDKLVVINPDSGTTPDIDNSYSATSSSATVLSDGTRSIGTWTLNDGGFPEQAFWTERDIIDVFYYVWNTTGSGQSPQETTGSTTVEWNSSTPNGAYYTQGGNIHMGVDNPDTSKSVIHEFGHNIMYTVYGNTFPTTNCPSPHYLKSSSHVNCAWTEGWANGLVVLVTNDPVLRYYSGATENIETPTWGTTDWDEGDDVEGRIVGVLWDLVDGNNEGTDKTSNLFPDLWDTLYHQNDNNLSEFWSAWQSRHSGSKDNVLLSIYQNSIDYRTCHLLTRARNTSSGGSVPTASPANSTGCTSGNYKSNQAITVTASPATGWKVGSWSGTNNNASTSNTNTVTMPNAARTVTVNYILKTYSLTVSKAGTGSGTVTSSPAGISCGSDCSQTYNYNTSVTLTAAPSTSSTFTGWSGACTGTGSCIVTMTAAKSVTATFTLKTYTLTVSKAGNGSGTVTSNPAGISCGSDCSQTYNYNTSVTLTAAPSTSSTFTGWSGACTGTGSCIVTMTAAKSVTATFTLKTYTLTVSKAGNGSGTVTSNPAGISCGSDCSQTYNYNTSVTLTAAAASGSTFTGWSGACTGTGTCNLTMTAAKSVTATFTRNCYALTRTHTGSGDDPIASPTNSSGCASGSYHSGQSISLTANPASGWTVSSWSGTDNNASTSKTNTVTMPVGTRTATVNYVEIPLTCYALTRTHTGNGSDPSANPSNSSGCASGSYHAGESITVTATPTSGWSVGSWSGTTSNGSTSTTNTVTMPESVHTVTVNYVENPPPCYTLTRNYEGSGSQPTASPTNSTGCASGQYTAGQTITMTANPASGYHLEYWTGTNASSSNILNMPASAHTVTATYVQDVSPGNCNTTPININSSGAASLYPSNIIVAGLDTSTTDVNVQLRGLSHTWPADIDILLVGPQGQNLIIQSDAGGSTAINDLNLTLDDSAAQYLSSVPLTGGTFLPTNYSTGDTFPAPAPSPSGFTTLATFNGTNPNGTWSLYITDDAAGDSGSLANGWCLDITASTTTKPPRPTNLQASDGTYTDRVQLDWDASSGATSYRVYRAASARGVKSLLGRPTLPSFADTTATPGQTYYYWVKACNASGCSIFSVPNTGWRKQAAAGFISSFNGSSAGWWRVRGNWLIASGKYYRSTGLANLVASAKHINAYADMTYQVRMKRTGTCTSCVNRIIIRGTPTSLTASNSWKPSYSFQYTNSGYFSVFEITGDGSSVALKDWTTTAAIVKNGWNTLKVVAVGPSLKFYINNHLVWNGSDDTLTTGQVGFGFYRDAAAGILYVDWAKLTTSTVDLNIIEQVEAGVEVPGGSLERSP